MNLKGMDTLRKHVPELRTKGGIAIVLSAFAAVVILTTIFFYMVDTRFSIWEPDGEIIFLALGLLIMSRFFSQKNIYQQKYGDLAFRNAFARFHIPGLGILFASILHLGTMFGVELPDLWWKTTFIGIGWLFVIAGVLLWVRTVMTFGLDNLSMLYVYFPKESRMTNSSIYQILRHPIYAAAIDIGIGLAIIHANWYSLLVALILPIFLFGWVRLVEEKELLERFPDYSDYRVHVPAFIIKPGDSIRFIRFLVSGDQAYSS
jgi:protein-S-isoprenylcysteine O-methyltransferase Ste14